VDEQVHVVEDAAVGLRAARSEELARDLAALVRADEEHAELARVRVDRGRLDLRCIFQRDGALVEAVEVVDDEEGGDGDRRGEHDGKHDAGDLQEPLASAGGGEGRVAGDRGTVRVSGAAGHPASIPTERRRKPGRSLRK
jgi:hypothetical protein